MARSAVISALAAMVLLAGCGTRPETAARDRLFLAGDWYAISAGATGPSSIEIHQTRYGLQGRIWSADQMYPVRNLVVADGAMSFIVPALEASWSGKAGDAHTWSGTWTSRDGAKVRTLTPTGAPDLKGGTFVTLADGRQMFLDCRGSGAPVVVFDAGAGGTTRSWRTVHEEIARTTRACAYDRAGHGLSDPRPLPLDAATVANDLDEMLKAALVPAPYVLVGHSLGSYHVRQYANTRFSKMAGMVLVDPSGDGQQARFDAVIPEAMAFAKKTQSAAAEAGCAAKLRARLVMRDDPLFKTCNGSNDADIFEHTQSEIDAMTGPSLAALTTSRRLWGAMPLIVLTRSDYQKGSPPEYTDRDLNGLKTVWLAMHEEMVKLSTAGEHRIVPDAGHSIQMDQPQAVIQAVDDVVARVRSGVGKH
jgi:pimeloyl-ACP methyl ester carboxylesterase